MGELARLLEMLRVEAKGYDVVLRGHGKGCTMGGCVITSHNLSDPAIFFMGRGPTPEAAAADALLQLADGLTSLTKPGRQAGQI